MSETWVKTSTYTIGPSQLIILMCSSLAYIKFKNWIPMSVVSFKIIKKNANVWEERKEIESKRKMVKVVK